MPGDLKVGFYIYKWVESKLREEWYFGAHEIIFGIQIPVSLTKVWLEHTHTYSFTCDCFGNCQTLAGKTQNNYYLSLERKSLGCLYGRSYLALRLLFLMHVICLIVYQVLLRYMALCWKYFQFALAVWGT